ncbi:MAG: STY4528 family pathogenicity island replication protein [Proteobacteria bacterium]|nr:STY4528 family pathogenicity island replication protein [Pseudomonadota bacterium]
MIPIELQQPPLAPAVDASLRPETLALDALIEATVDRIDGEPVANDAMLFVSNRHDAIPDGVIEDPTLEPVDKIAWMVIKRHAGGAGSSSSFPTYAEICQKVNVASKTTVVRCVAILRIARWLTLCARLREPCGRFRRNIYALHDEPLPLADTLHLDSQYLEFLDASLTHPHARVRAVAQVTREAADLFNAGQAEVGERFGQPSKTAQVVTLQNLHRRSSSSLCIRKKTTTTTEIPDSVTRTTNEHGGPLTYPSRFSANQCELAGRLLAGVPAELRQRILDETEGRIRAERRGMPAVYDDLRFLASLCRAALKGEFQANLAFGVEAEREARARERQLPIVSPVDTAPDRAAAIATAQSSLAELRAVLGMPGPPSGHSVSTRKP